MKAIKKTAARQTAIAATPISMRVPPSPSVMMARRTPAGMRHTALQ
jgi:hypothetical protein